ncbi:flavin reductase family protein [Gordonia sp. Z-3]|uniref:flavin reductase family protein n=1 Tax=Gordonia sp. Z-3 TaxID=3115408 RepID=UPI002E2AA39C|nr:flavin reductase family protein [Gordonia sp. Z-3]MED5800628.1 flavin reductase family protein [Gordonia sp. Z-3]
MTSHVTTRDATRDGLIANGDIDPPAQAPSARNLRRVWGNFATGVAVITAHDGERPIGFTCQSVVSVSLDPPLMSFCPSRTSTTWPLAREVGALCINILAADQQEMCRQFAVSGADKFRGIDWSPTGNGAPAISGALAHIDGHLVSEHDAGDHSIAVAAITALSADEDSTPLLFFRGSLSGLAG